MSEISDKLQAAFSLSEQRAQELYGHNALSSMAEGTWMPEGAKAENSRLKDIHKRVIECVRAFEKMGMQCVNTGNYGPMKIRPGECVCSTCTAKNALTNLKDTVFKQRGDT